MPAAHSLRLRADQISNLLDLLITQLVRVAGIRNKTAFASEVGEHAVDDLDVGDFGVDSVKLLPCAAKNGKDFTGLDEEINNSR